MPEYASIEQSITPQPDEKVILSRINSLKLLDNFPKKFESLMELYLIIEDYAGVIDAYNELQTHKIKKNGVLENMMFEACINKSYPHAKQFYNYLSENKKLDEILTANIYNFLEQAAENDSAEEFLRIITELTEVNFNFGGFDILIFNKILKLQELTTETLNANVQEIKDFLRISEALIDILSQILRKLDVKKFESKFDFHKFFNLLVGVNYPSIKLDSKGEDICIKYLEIMGPHGLISESCFNGEDIGKWIRCYLGDENSFHKVEEILNYSKADNWHRDIHNAFTEFLTESQTRPYNPEIVRKSYINRQYSTSQFSDSLCSFYIELAHVHEINEIIFDIFENSSDPKEKILPPLFVYYALMDTLTNIKLESGSCYETIWKLIDEYGSIEREFKSKSHENEEFEDESDLKSKYEEKFKKSLSKREEYSTLKDKEFEKRLEEAAEKAAQNERDDINIQEDLPHFPTCPTLFYSVKALIKDRAYEDAIQLYQENFLNGLITDYKRMFVYNSLVSAIVNGHQSIYDTEKIENWDYSNELLGLQAFVAGCSDEEILEIAEKISNDNDAFEKFLSNRNAEESIKNTIEWIKNRPKVIKMIEEWEENYKIEQAERKKKIEAGEIEDDTPEFTQEFFDHRFSLNPEQFEFVYDEKTGVISFENENEKYITIELALLSNDESVLLLAGNYEAQDWGKKLIRIPFATHPNSESNPKIVDYVDDLIVWGIYHNEPLAVQLGELYYENTGNYFPEYLASQVAQFYKYQAAGDPSHLNNSFSYAKLFLRKPLNIELNPNMRDYQNIVDDPEEDRYIQAFNQEMHTRPLFHKFARKKGILKGELFGYKIPILEKARKEVGITQPKPKFRPHGASY